MRSSPSTDARCWPCHAGSGFDLSAYLVPVIALRSSQCVALALGIGRWRRAGEQPGRRRGTPAGPPDEDAERLEADIARYDL